MGAPDISPTVLVLMLLAIIFSVFLVIAIFLLGGVVIRYRINYTPIGVGLGDLGDGDEQRLSQDMRVGPVVNSVWAMFARVKRLEGWSGFFKGLMPVLIVGLANTVIGSFFIGARASPKPALAVGGPINSTIWALLITLISIPGEILINRAVTTPHRLGWFSPRVSLRALFTPYELSRPYVLYLTPGLALAQALHVLYFMALCRGLRAVLMPSYHPNSTPFTDEGFGGFWAYAGAVAYTIFLILSCLVLSPLEVLGARLSVQRNHSKSGSSLLPTSDPDAVDPAQSAAAGLGATTGLGAPTLPYAGEEEDVIALRDEDAPYTSLMDAYRKVVEEEGRKTLYRCWWLTVIAAIGAGFS